jgi:hypothetical protein
LTQDGGHFSHRWTSLTTVGYGATYPVGEGPSVLTAIFVVLSLVTDSLSLEIAVYL